ncbi:MAG: tRNA (adenosine(37)-N6)-threonylcarbamoyltransferase complex transferase subunit TsaD [Syntrophobacterales bacterium]|nr:tRNA (adenosine(37)-N6)-threonylcarbamoyltransferase complex transferase subunit TsaD [Syntrophobacterales bacterium]
MIILGIESSCDETAAAIVERGRIIRSQVVASQISVHSPYGGVVPELASRKHVEAIIPVIDKAVRESGCSLDEIDAIGVTCGPGLVGSLLVGIAAAKAIAYALDKPLIPVNHLEGHLWAAFLGGDPPSGPSVCLVVSGGHTALYFVKPGEPPQLLGTTLDDAAGEAFDKVAKLLGLGYPGGVVIDRLSEQGNPQAVSFPRSFLGRDSFDFSFSGIKTAVVNFVKKFGSPLDSSKEILPYRVEDVVASFQEAIVDVLLEKTTMAAERKGVRHVAVVGGVAANRRLRERFTERAMEKGWDLRLPPLAFCTDNAVMIAAAAYEVWKREGFCRDLFSVDALSRWY